MQRNPLQILQQSRAFNPRQTIKIHRTAQETRTLRNAESSRMTCPEKFLKRTDLYSDKHISFKAIRFPAKESRVAISPFRATRWPPFAIRPIVPLCRIRVSDGGKRERISNWQLTMLPLRPQHIDGLKTDPRGLGRSRRRSVISRHRRSRCET